MNKKFSKILGVGLAIVVLASLFVFAVPAQAITSPTTAVTVTPATISANAQYVIKFDTYFPLTGGTGNNADYITLVFPNLTTVPTGYTNSETSGISVSKDNGTTYYNIISANLTEASRTFVIRVPSDATTTGAAHMAVKFLTSANISNPGTAGSYIISVKTSQETTAVDLSAYSIVSPLKVERYNKQGNFVGTYSTITDALAASADYDTLKLGAGTFEESFTISKNYITIVALDTSAKPTIGSSSTGQVTISGNYTTLDSLTIKGKVIVSAGVTNATIQNVSLSKRSSTATSAYPLITNSGVDLTVKDSTLDTTSGTVAGTMVDMAAAGATAKFSGVTFKVDADTGLVSDKAIVTTAALTTATNSLVVESSTITGDGTGGIGYYDAVGSIGVVIKKNTFSALEQAINIAHADAKATIQGNTIKNSILSGTGTAALGTIALGANKVITIEGNTIKDNLGYSLKVTDSENVTVSGNSFSNNTKGLRNTDSVNNLNAKLNWWGATTGPTHAVDNPSGTGEIISDYVTFKPYLTGDTSGANAARIATTTAATASSLDASTTAGIAVDGVTTAAAAQIVATKLAANPKTVEPAYTALAGAWFDLYISAASSTTITAKFYATGITSQTKSYFWSGLQGKWVEASNQGVSGDGTFVWVNIKATGATDPTVPTTSDLTGTPFVLVAAPAAASTVTVATISLTTPAAGATGSAVTSLPFTWASVSGATSYSLVISASADLSSPMVTATTTVEAYQYSGTLSNSTNYFWQVTALKDTTTVGKSAIGYFTTVAAPVVVKPPPAVVAPIALVSPANGSTNVPIEPTFVWTAYTGAISYEIVVSTDNTFKIIDYSRNVAKEQTFFKSETLAYATTYYWRVRGVTGPAPAKKAAPGGPWATGVFTTEPKPVPPAKVEPTVITIEKPAPPAEVKIVEVPVPTVVPQPIPSYLLWLIIGIGAVLIIALIVLIVRTRRVA